MPSTVKRSYEHLVKNDTCPEIIAMNLLKANPNISISDLQGKTGITYNQASVFKKAFVSGDRAVIKKITADIVESSMEKISALNIVDSKLSEHFEFNATAESKPIGIAFLADLHIGSDGTAYSLMKSDFDLIGKTDGLYTIFGGDATDNFIKESMTGAIIAATTTPGQQLEMFSNLMKKVEHKTVAVVTGNHDLWTDKLSGINPIEKICKSRRLVYAKHQLRLQVNMDGMNYGIGIRHQLRNNSSKNPCAPIKTWRHENATWPFDIGFAGHNHVACVESFQHESKEHWALRCGSYKMVDDYGQQLGFVGAIPVMPVVILYPHERKILAFSDLRSGIEVLTSLRKMPKSERQKIYPEVDRIDVTVIDSCELAQKKSKRRK